MKFAFSTVGCPDWGWSEILASAKDLGYDGVEVRGIGGQLNLPKAREFAGPGMEATKAALARMGLAIPCLASSCYLHDGRNAEATVEDGKAYIDLASKLEAQYVRVLGDTNPEPGTDASTFSLVVDALSVLGRYAASKGVTVLLETNGVFANTNTMLKAMASVGGPGVGVLWDIHHPYRFFNEPVEQTWKALKDHIRHIHVKDSKLVESKLRYTLVGQGDVPVARVLDLLSESGYDGWVCLEWVKRWRPDLEEPGLVFPHFIEYVAKYR